MAEHKPGSADCGLPLTGFTDHERAADMDGSLTSGRIELELRLMAGTKRARLLEPLIATFTDGVKPVQEVRFAVDTWDGETWHTTPGQEPS